jgi:hypothetical protein
MDIKILVILILIVVVVYFCYSDNINEHFSQSLRLSNVFGANSSRTRHNNNNHDDHLYNIDFNNNKQVNKNNYKFHSYDENKKNYLPIKYKFNPTITLNNIKSKVPMTYCKYKFRGLIANTYYKQYYILYEKEYTNFNLDDKLYKYLLVKKTSDSNKFEIVHKIPPRTKVENGDSIYFSYGNFQLGPLKFV